LYGKPNVGKSTLLNALVGEDRSIVHETPGTTRDVLEVNWQVDTLPAVLVDVAGIREGDSIHPVEAIGIERAKKEFERADLILWLIDSTDPVIPSFDLPWISTPLLKVLTKKDLFHDALSTLEKEGREIFPVHISAKTGEGIADLVTRIKEVLTADLPDASEVLLTRLRHVNLAQDASMSLSAAIDSFASGVSDECVAYELRDTGRSLDELLGKSLNEEVLDLIFSRFCIGK
jgi:tRNA modification GTPase